MISVSFTSHIDMFCIPCMTPAAGIIFSATIISDLFNFTPRHHSNRQIQIRTVIILMIYKSCLCHIYGFLFTKSQNPFLIPCPGFYPYILLLCDSSDRKYGNWDFYFILCRNLSDSSSRRHVRFTAVNPRASASNNTPFQPISPNCLYNIIRYTSRTDDSKLITFLHHFFSRIMKPAVHCRLHCHNLK